ncbi:RNA-binding S4 domain-containing protein [Pseudorhodobacter sp. W20_MBD10_FR17]|uniref:RNA-binding S4 domain-containing protein n=1 Tax=Pseudorhodobacter sp. W20_MBD10_FR17 TaxID=3240266 RepID=UPI003F94461C
MAGRKDKAEGGRAAPADPTPDKVRLDKWLFYARFFKTRALASTVITKGRVRLNGQRQSKPGHAIAAGDTLTFPMGDEKRSIRVLATGTRRGPASEAQTLYHDLEDTASNGASPLE